MPTYECDVCIIGSGLSSAMLSEKLTEKKPGLQVIVVEAGKAIFDVGNRLRYRQRWLDYGENPWPDDFVEDQLAEGIICHTMAVGGQALIWGGACNRFSVEDLRLKSMFGLAVDWPLEYADLEKAYCEAERRLNVAGEPSPYPEDRRTQPYPQPAMPLTYNLQLLKAWAEKSGLKFTALPVARNIKPSADGRGACCTFNSCVPICPNGARYSPDWTFRNLVAQKRITLHDRTLIRRLVLDDARPTIAAAQGVHQDRPDQTAEYRATLFVVAAGYAWSPHLLLLSACSRFPNGLANSSGLVGCYMNGHKFFSAQATVALQIYPGQNTHHSLISRHHLRCAPDAPFVRHDTRMWESAVGRSPRLRDDKGRLLLGDELMSDWRTRTAGGSARLRAYYDVHPSKDSRLTLDTARKNRYGDPLPRIEHRFDEATLEREQRVQQHILSVFERMAKADGGKVAGGTPSDYLDHPGGGCRMGDVPATSVVDSHGRAHDHENLFIVGAPTTPTAGCVNGALTFAALALRSGDRILETLAPR
jgi:choline dehydrogenase-like flavoprotein